MTSAEIWVFNADGARFPGAVFAQRPAAEQWIKQYRLTGTLTLYPLNEGAYDWALRTGNFTPKKEATPSFVGSFTSASQEHYHYTNGEARE